MLTEMDLTDDAGEQVVHLDVDQRRHLDVLAVVRVGDRLAFCNQNKQSKSYFCVAGLYAGSNYCQSHMF